MDKLLHTVAIIFFLSFTAQAHAQTYAFGGSTESAILTLTFDNGTSDAVEATSQGWWSTTAANFRGNNNVITGSMFGTQWNDFFVFDLTGLTGTVTAASIGLNTKYVAGTPSVALWDVTTPLSALENIDNGPDRAIYADLGSGTLYGDAIPVTTGNTHISLALNSAGIVAVGNALGGSFAIGGSANTDIPEPSGLFPLLPALTGVWAARYRFRQASKRSALS